MFIFSFCSLIQTKVNRYIYKCIMNRLQAYTDNEQTINIDR